jgi:hypothetical protein
VLIIEFLAVPAYSRPNIYASSTVPRLMRLATVLGLPPYSIFTIKEIKDATNNFDPSNLIREGSLSFFYIEHGITRTAI